MGPELAVVAGPHLDFSTLGEHDVYTVELRSPPSGGGPHESAVLQLERLAAEHRHPCGLGA